MFNLNIKNMAKINIISSRRYGSNGFDTTWEHDGKIYQKLIPFYGLMSYDEYISSSPAKYLEKAAREKPEVFIKAENDKTLITTTNYLENSNQKFPLKTKWLNFKNKGLAGLF